MQCILVRTDLNPAGFEMGFFFANFQKVKSMGFLNVYIFFFRLPSHEVRFIW